MTEIVGVIDTGVFCCWLEVPGRETAGSAPNLWNAERARAEIDAVICRRGTLILPNSVVLEVGRMISQAPHSRRTKSEQLLNRVQTSLDAVTPWRRFNESERLWTKDWYREAANQWPKFADNGLSLTDYSLLSIVRFYRNLSIDAQLLTTEAKLKREADAIPLEKKSKQRERRRTRS